jgi:hypothetical protein
MPGNPPKPPRLAKGLGYAYAPPTPLAPADPVAPDAPVAPAG